MTSAAGPTWRWSVGLAFVLAELKTDKGKTTPSQDEWLALIGACPGVEVHVWRPVDFNDVVDALR